MELNLPQRVSGSRNVFVIYARGSAGNDDPAIRLQLWTDVHTRSQGHVFSLQGRIPSREFYTMYLFDCVPALLEFSEVDLPVGNGALGIACSGQCNLGGLHIEAEVLQAGVGVGAAFG